MQFSSKLPPLIPLDPEQDQIRYTGLKPLQFEGVHGVAFMRPSEVDFFAGHVGRAGHVFEIGSANGATVAAALLGYPEATAVCVDVFHDFSEDLKFDSGEAHAVAWLRNRKATGDRMSLWVGDYLLLLSQNSFLQQQRLVLLDADHSYEATRRELLRLSVAFCNHDNLNEVVLLVHDYEVPSWPGVTRAVNELVQAGDVAQGCGSSLFDVVGRAESLLELRFRYNRMRALSELLKDKASSDVADAVAVAQHVELVQPPAMETATGPQMRAAIQQAFNVSGKRMAEIGVAAEGG